MSIISLCLSHCVSFFICLAVETSASFQVVFIGNCSVNTCHFCVFMGGCKLRVFLLHHFHHQPRGLLDGCSTSFFLNVDISQHSYHLSSILSSKLSLIILTNVNGWQPTFILTGTGRRNMWDKAENLSNKIVIDPNENGTSA